MKIISTFKNRILIPFRLVPKEGLPPGKLAFSVMLGIICGIFPVIGTTTLLSLLLTMLFRKNLLIVQSVQWLMAPIQILIIIPFIHFGAYLLNHQAMPVNLAQIQLAFRPGILPGIKTIGIFHLYGILTWFILVIPVGILSYYILLGIFKKKKQNP